MPERLELGAQLAVVVDAAVEDDRSEAVAHRLRAALGQVDDRQPPVHEACVSVEPHAGAVRPARRERLAHPLERRAIRPRPPAQLDAEAAHG